MSIKNYKPKDNTNKLQPLVDKKSKEKEKPTDSEKKLKSPPPIRDKKD